VLRADQLLDVLLAADPDDEQVVAAIGDDRAKDHRLAVGRHGIRERRQSLCRGIGELLRLADAIGTAAEQLETSAGGRGRDDVVVGRPEPVLIGARIVGQARQHLAFQVPDPDVLFLVAQVERQPPD
jgi:hypothetical protein